MNRSACAGLLVITASATLAASQVAPQGASASAVCAASHTATGADYQRAIALDDGRVLWLFQDAFVDDGGGAPTLSHNLGMLQPAEEHECATLLTGGDGDDPWIAADLTDDFEHWYWPMAGYQSGPATATVFVAEMIERGDHYLANPEPVATWTVEIDLDTMQPSPLEPAPDASSDLYGWSEASDGEWRYLYGYCNRQFGYSDFGHDECTERVSVARQPIADSSAALTYWDGSRWVADPEAAIDISPTTAPDGSPRGPDPMQVRHGDDGWWYAVTKPGDWWGDAVFYDVAPNPYGPWTTTAVVPMAAYDVGVEPGTNSYFASFAPVDPNRVIISQNCWEVPACPAYRPASVRSPEQLWTKRAAVDVGDGLALPIGHLIESAARLEQAQTP